MTGPLIDSDMVAVPNSDHIGIALSATVIVFSLVAVSNLLFGIAVPASGLWLAVVAAFVWSGVKSAGSVRNLVVAQMGMFARNHFAECAARGGAVDEIRFGYRIFRSRILCLTIPVEGVESVEWSTGQLTAHGGDAANDWHVSVWYDHHNEALAKNQRSFPRPHQDLHVAGSAGTKAQAEALATSLVALLRRGGADLARADKQSTFVRRAP